MTLNKDLFFELCKEYGVPFSTEYDTIMFDDGSHIRELCEEDVEHIMLLSETVSYSDVEYNVNVPRVALSPMGLLPDNLLVAA